jgi:glucose-6-phosphate 1-dehydrogenase
MKISPTIIVIFGGAGDLTWRKLIPSLFDLHRADRMPKEFAIIFQLSREFFGAIAGRLRDAALGRDEQ